MGSSIESLKEHCRAAAMGDYDWPELLGEIAQWVGGTKGMFLGLPSSGPYQQTLSWNHDPDLLHRYNDRYNLFDPRAPYSKVTPLHFCQLGQEYVRNEEIDDTNYFDAINRAGNVADSVHGIIADDAELGRQTISIQRGFEQEFFSRSEADKLASILPHLEHAIRDSLRIARVLGAQGTDGDYAYLLVDGGLNVQVFEEIGTGTIALGEKVLTVENGRLVCGNAMAEMLTTSAIEQALGGHPAAFNLGAIRAEFSPVPAPLRWLGGSDCVFATISRRTARDLSRAQLFAAAYRFSDRETEILSTLLENPDLRASAVRLGMSYETLRWHVKNMCQKSGHNRREAMLAAAQLAQFTVPDAAD